MKPTTLIIFFLVSFFSLSAQSLSFDIILLGKKIGAVQAERVLLSDGIEKYTIRSNSYAKVLFTERQSEMLQESIFSRGVLLSAHTMNKVDGVTEEIRVRKNGQQYIVDKKQEQLFIRDKIVHSAVWMYFHEPVNIQRIFSERMGQFTTLSCISPGQYSYTVTDGATNVVKYKDGYPEEIEIKKGLGSVWMKRVKMP
jgi:hypothetical protein